jgi:acyl-coenzyme A synthetase/AMP-(fatty) acid ligase
VKKAETFFRGDANDRKKTRNIFRYLRKDNMNEYLRKIEEGIQAQSFARMMGLHTGDMARRDEDGYFYIVGRQSRFIKIAGKRIGLDEVEKILRTAFPDLDLACAGKDEDLHVFAVAAGETLTENGNENSGKNGGENKGDKAFKELEEKICSKDH